MPYATYVSHENGARGIRVKAARDYARAFKVDASWILYGVATGDEHLTPKAMAGAELSEGTESFAANPISGIDVEVSEGVATVRARVTKRNYTELLKKVQALELLLK